MSTEECCWCKWICTQSLALPPPSERGMTRSIFILDFSQPPTLTNTAPKNMLLMPQGGNKDRQSNSLPESFPCNGKKRAGKSKLQRKRIQLKGQWSQLVANEVTVKRWLSSVPQHSLQYCILSTSIWPCYQADRTGECGLIGWKASPIIETLYFTNIDKQWHLVFKWCFAYSSQYPILIMQNQTNWNWGTFYKIPDQYFSKLASSWKINKERLKK